MFQLDERIQSSCFTLTDWPLSRVLLKNEAGYPWFLLVPRKNNIQEIHQLTKEERELLMEEVNQLSLVLNAFYKPEKLNIGALGNIVSQLHIHLVARSKQDALWPHGIWQSSFTATPYPKHQIESLVPDLKALIEQATP